VAVLASRQMGPVTILRMGRNIGKWVFYYVHSFVLGEILIDTSTVYVADELKAELQGKKISAIINTHFHEDHTGNNRLLQEVMGAEIYAPPEALPHLAQPDTRQPLYIKLCWSRPEPSTGLPLGENIRVGDFTLQVIPTPGHSPDHVCLYEAQHRLLFSGDLICGERVKYLRADEDFHLLLASLKQLQGLEIDTIFCAVSGVFPNGNQVLQNKINFMENLQAEVLDQNRKGRSPARIRRQLLGREGMMYYMSGGHFAKQNLVNSILGMKNN